MKVLVFGAGGIGSLLGGFLARSGHEVMLLGRSGHLDVVRKNGLSITGLWGDYRIKAFDTATQVSDLAGVSFDLILVTVKAYDTVRAAAELRPLVGPTTTVLSIQNGIGNKEALLETLKPKQLLLGVAMIGVELEPGLVRVTVAGEKPLTLGALSGASPGLTAVQAAHTLSSAKLTAVAVENIDAAIWVKLIYNCALNGLCTLNGWCYEEILTHEDARQLMHEIVRECYAVGLGSGVRLEPSTPEAYIDLLEQKLIPQTAAHHPSLAQDLKKGKRLDIESLNGAVARLGRQFGILTPQNITVFDQVLNLAPPRLAV